mgnify:CR=1 FL=1
MAKTSWLKTLRAHFPGIAFVEGDSFRWSPRNSTVYAGSLETNSDLMTLLHETGHALADHVTYTQDIQLIKLEREAWDIAKTRLAPLFNIEITDDTIEEALGSYRDWLHARSRCPECESTGVQQDELHYRCLACQTTWKVNDARTCQLRRYIKK